MPQLKREMSWLSPRRRRTTGNLKADQNAPSTNGKLSNESNRTSTTSPTGSPMLERPSKAHRAITLSDVDDIPSADANLFYAYARKGDDLHSRFLLTFASAAIANEWWLLLQIHFPGTSRPGPQLFSFKEDDLLSKAWQHSSFAHLKSKWMYISFSDAAGVESGGAAQSIIPVQDARGNMLGGAGVKDIDGLLPELRDEAQEMVRSEVGRLEEYVKGMMEALQRNTEKAAELAAKIQGPVERKRASREISEAAVSSSPALATGNYFDMDALSTHFGQLNQSLTENSQNVAKLAQQHEENEQKLRETLETLVARDNNAPGLDMPQLSSHLDRIQNMMETSARDRKDSAREPAPVPQSIDLSPLTQRLERVQEAVEQNSALVKALLDEGLNAPEPKEQPSPQLDLNPLNESLERIHAAIKQQSEHTKALVGFASGDAEGSGDAGAVFHDRNNLTPLSEHLEQIYNAIEEGNKQARETQPLKQHLEALQSHGEQTVAHMASLLEGQTATRKAIEANGGELDISPLAEHLEAIRESTDASTEAVKRSMDSQVEAAQKSLDFTPLTTHLKALRDATERSAGELRSFVDAQQASTSAARVDLTPLTNHLSSIRSTLEEQSRHREPSSEAPSLPTALTSHLETIQSLMETNATQMKSLREKHATSATKMQNAVADTSVQIRALIERNQRNESKIEAQDSQMRELMSGQREMVEVMRQLAKSIAARDKEGVCGHVVIPPPRKMNRKLVGFVYDTKDGAP